MRKLLKLEMGKAIKNKWFFVALFIGGALATISAVNNIVQYLEFGEVTLEYAHLKYLGITSSSAYKFWIVNDFLQPTTDLFFILLPLLAVIPYGWSYASEKKSGYFQQMLSRVSRLKYFSSKALATFLSGAFVVAIPVVLNFIMCASMIPLFTPDVSEVIWFGIFPDALWSSVFYNHPFVYTLLFTGLIFVFAGLWAAATSFFALLINNRLALMVIPYLLLFFLKYLNEGVLIGITRVALSPLSYLRAVSLFSSSGYLILAQLLVLFAFVVFALRMNMKRDVL